MENASIKPDNHAGDMIKGELNMRDMLKALNLTLLEEGVSAVIDQARKILLPGLFFSAWNFRIVVAALLDHSWVGIADFGSFKIPTKIDDLHMGIDCCRVLELKVRQYSFLQLCCIL